MTFEYLEQDKSFLAPTWYISYDSESPTVNLNEIILDNTFNKIDYKSNYIAYLTKYNIDNDTPAFFIGKYEDLVNTNIYLLNILRIPVKKYETKQDIIKEINKSYAYSILNAVEDNYIEDATITNGEITYDIYGKRKYVDFIDLTELLNYDVNNLDTSNKTIDFSTRAKEIITLHEADDNNNVPYKLSLMIINNKSFSIHFEKAYLNESYEYAIEFNNETKKYYINMNNKEYLNENIINFFSNANISLIIFNYDDENEQFIIDIYKTNETNETNHNLLRLTIKQNSYRNNFIISFLTTEETFKFTYENMLINDYEIINTNGNFNVLYTKSIINQIISDVIKLIEDYNENTNVIKYRNNIIPVNLKQDNFITRINSPLKNITKSEKYTTKINNPKIIVNENGLDIDLNKYMDFSTINNNCYYSSFNVNKNNLLDYLCISDYIVTVSTDNLLSIDNTFFPIIKGNFLTTYIYITNTIYDNLKNKDIDLNNIEFKNTYTINTNEFNTFDDLHLCSTYSSEVDNIINNNTNYNNVVFNIVKDFEYNGQPKIEINTNIKPSNNGIYIYLTGNKIQWPFYTNGAKLKISYLK